MAMELQDKKKSYSDLEVIITSGSTVPTSSSSSSASTAPRQSYWNEKFIATPNSPDPKVQQHNEKGAALDVSPVDTLPPPPPAYYLVDSKGQTQALYTVPSDNSDAGSIVNFKGGYNAAFPPPEKSGWWTSLGEGRRICGLRKNIFLAAMAGVCFLIFGLLATILVLTIPGVRKHDDSPRFSTKELVNKKDVGPILRASDLAAMNWTDVSSGTSYSGVFYQSSAASGSALMVAIKNEKTQTWNTVNISASASTGSKPLDVLSGTPLAAASNNGLWNVYYLTSLLTIAEVYSTDPTNPSSWLQGSFSSAMNFPGVIPGSQLSAMWQLCKSCNNSLFVMWQNTGGSIVVANMTNMTWGQPMTIAQRTDPGSGLAISAFTDTGPKVTTGSDHNAIRMYYEQNGGLMETIVGPIGGRQPVAGNFAKPIQKDLAQQPSPKLASLTYGSDADGWTSNLITYIDPYKGTLTTANWKPGADWKVAEPTLNGGPSDLVKNGFSSIAQTQEMKIYVLSPKKSEIHEYTTNSTDVFTWTWKDKVDI